MIAPTRRQSAAREAIRLSAAENGQALNGPHMRDWQTNMRLVSWGRETYPLAERKLDRLVDRVYGAYAFPRIR